MPKNRQLRRDVNVRNPVALKEGIDASVAVVTALPAGNNNIGNVDVETAPDVYASDAAFIPGEDGSLSLGVRKDTAASLVDADGDRTPFIFDADGKLWTTATLTGDVNLEGDASDLDSGAGTDEHSVVAIGLPASGGHVVGGTSTDPFRTDPTGTTTQPVSAASLPLPTGAATEVTSAALLTELQLKADLTETQPVSAASLPLPTGASTAANQLADGHDVNIQVGNSDVSATNRVPTEIYGLEVASGNVTGVAIFEKYGKNPDIDTGSAPEDIWNGANDYTGFPTGSAETLEIFSSNANDTAAGTGARTVRIFNLLDSTGAEVADVDVSLNGTTAVSLGAGLYYRGGSRMKVLTAGSGGENAGELTLRHTTTTANIFAVMPALNNQTAICAYTVPLGKTLYVNRLNMQLGRANGANGSATMTFRARENGAVFNSVVNPTITNQASYTFSGGYFMFPARTDLKMRCEDVSDNNTIITAEFGGYLVDD